MSYDTLSSPIKCMCATFLRRIGGVNGGLGNQVQTEESTRGQGLYARDGAVYSSQPNQCRDFRPPRLV